MPIGDAMILSIGEILFDIFPKYRRIGGAPFNFAFHLQSLGFDARFISRVGDDDNGLEILDFLKKRNFNAQFIQIDPDHQTGEVRVTLDNDGNARFHIVENTAYDYVACTDMVQTLMAKADLIYYGSLIQRSSQGFQQVQEMLKSRGKNARCLYDVNFRPRCYDKTIVLASLTACDILKLNNDELPIIQEMLSIPGDANTAVSHLMENYDLEMVALTLGGDGSRLYTREELHDAAPPENLFIVDTVGAGDGFTAILAAGYLAGWKGGSIVKTATQFASAICQIEGAIPEHPDFYTPFRSQFQ